jgi:orotate phosphoribosyltransferase
VDGRTELLSLLRSDALLHGDFVLASGRRSDFYVDARRVTLSARGSRLIGELVFQMLGPDLPDAVAGMTIGADPIVTAVATTADLHVSKVDGLLVRKEAKPHGTGRRIEGPWRPGMRVVVVEDTSTTGGSAMQAVEAIKVAGGKVFRVITLIDRQEGAEDRVRDAGLRFDALFRMHEILAPAPAGVADNLGPIPSRTSGACAGDAAHSAKEESSSGAGPASRQTRAVVVRADGASTGNPGPAGAGYLVSDTVGKELTRGSKYLGIATNNVAEYQALLAGLRAAMHVGATHVTVRMDSELVIKQMRGQYRVKNESLRPLYENAKRAAAGFTKVVFEAVPREQNKVADSLATAAAARRGS